MAAGGAGSADSRVLADASVPRGAGLPAANFFSLHYKNPWRKAAIRRGDFKKQLAAENYGSSVLGPNGAGSDAPTIC